MSIQDDHGSVHVPHPVHWIFVDRNAANVARCFLGPSKQLPANRESPWKGTWLVFRVSQCINIMYEGSAQLNPTPDDYFWLLALRDPGVCLGIDML